MAKRVVFAAFVLGLGACGSALPNNGNSPDMAPAPDLSPLFPAPHAMPPQVVTAGGAVLDSPSFVPVFFSNDDAATVTSLSDFYTKVVKTHYFGAATKEYGVGAASTAAPAKLTESATGTIDDSAIQTWLAA